MKPIGFVFKPKTSFETLKSELIPSFDSVLEDWINNVRRMSFTDPDHVLDITYITQPLRTFIEKIVERLDIPVVIGSPLERGFGFGKTHALILLWHFFTSDIYKRINMNIKDDIINETLVLGIECSKDKPFNRLIQELRTYKNTDHPITRAKDPLLIQAISQTLEEYDNKLYNLSTEEMAEIIVKALEKYEKLNGKPRFVLLLDELGYGLAQKLRSYIDKIIREEKEGKVSEAESIYNEANALVNFLSYLYSKLYGKHIPSIVIWVIAEQDRKEIEALAIKHRDNERIYNRISGLLKDLDTITQRYSRGLGGTSLAELSYNPEHALEIARYRILKTVEDIKLNMLQDEYLAWLEAIVKQLNLLDVFNSYKDSLKKFYPFSPGLIILLKKLMNSRDVPATEFVRSVIVIASEAAQKALSIDPEKTYTIGVKHLNIAGVVQGKLMREFESDWIDAAGDIESAISKLSGTNSNIHEAAEITAKYILAKGVTANIIEALDSKEKKDIQRYGSTINEIQLEIVSTYRESEALQIIEKLNEALEKLRAESARIDETEIEGVRYYMPSLFKTVYNKLASYIHDERKNLENKAHVPLYIKQTGTVPSLFYNMRVLVGKRSGDVVVALMEHRKVIDVNALINDPAFQEVQNKGKLLLIIVPPWDMDLFNNIYSTGISYEDIVNKIAERLQNTVQQGAIKRPLHVVILLPDIGVYRMDKLLDKLAIYEGTKKFLDYLSQKEAIIDARLREYEDTLVKRKDLLSIISEEIKNRHLKALHNKLEKEIIDARNFAQKELVKLSREIVVDVLETYRKAIYYSIDKNSFTTKDVIPSDSTKGLKSQEEVITVPDLSNYASIVNRFLGEVVLGLAYEYDTMKILKTLLDSYQKEFEKGIIREQDKISDIIENLLLGAYGIKPLSIDVAFEALKNLNNQKIDLNNETITLSVDEKAGFIKFIKEVKKSVEETEEVSRAKPTVPLSVTEIATIPPTPERTIQHIPLQLQAGFNVDDIRSRLIALFNILKNLEVEISSIDLKLETTSISLSLTLKKPIEFLSESSIKALMNLLSKISEKENKDVSMLIHLPKPIAEDNISKIFGDYLKAKHSSFDRYLPM